jgi:hypothetical protein
MASQAESDPAARRAEIGAGLFERHGVVALTDRMVDLAVATAQALVDADGDGAVAAAAPRVASLRCREWPTALTTLSGLDDVAFMEAVSVAEAGFCWRDLPPPVVVAAAICIDCARIDLEPGFEPRVDSLAVLHALLPPTSPVIAPACEMTH